MFEHLLRRALQNTDIYKDAVVESAAGLEEADGKEAEEGAVIALKGVGIDISSHRARWIGKVDLSQYDMIYFMDPGVKEIVHAHLEMQRVRSWSTTLVNEPDGIPNPFGKDQAAYQLALEVTQREVGRVMSEDFFPML
jgi:protein-tyrosine phosphatase